MEGMKVLPPASGCARRKIQQYAVSYTHLDVYKRQVEKVSYKYIFAQIGFQNDIRHAGSGVYEGLSDEKSDENAQRNG